MSKDNLEKIMLRGFFKIQFIVIVIMIIIAGGIIVWRYLVYPETPTADWNIHTNTQYGFEIKYPSDWQVDSDFPGRLSAGQTERRDGVDPKLFNFASLTKDLTIEENGDVILYVAPVGFNCEYYANLNNENISNFLKQNSDKSEIEFCKLKEYFRFGLMGDEKEIYQQMLSTFKFIQ
jgi:hypothetical protein